MVKLKTGQAINPYAITAQTAAQGLISAATSDLVVIRTQTRPRGRQAPIEYELHLNPASMGVGLVGLGLMTWLMQLRLHPQIVDVSEPPTKIYHAEVGHFETTTEYGHFGEPHTIQKWIVDIPASVEVIPSTVVKKKVYSVERRQGFGGDTTEPTVLDIGGLGPLGALTGTNPLFYGALYPLWRALGIAK
jgi:hypothetical protein